MLVEKTIGTIADYPGLEIEYVPLDWYESHKRIIKKPLSSGEDIGIRLSEADAIKGLNEGDVLAVIDEKKVIAVRIAPIEALIVDAGSRQMIPKVSFELGNKHAPFFQGEKVTEFYTPMDLPIKAMLEKIDGVTVKEGEVVLSKEKAISSSTGGGHSHSHGDHDHGHSHDDHNHDHHDYDHHDHDHHDHHDHDHHDHGHDHVLVVDTGSEKMIPKVAFEIGNRHAPFFIGEKATEFYTVEDAQVKAMLEKLPGVKVTMGHKDLDPEKAISMTGGGHGKPEEDGGYDGKGGTRLEESFYGGEKEDDAEHGHHHDHDHHDHGHCHDHNHDQNHSHEH